MIDNLKNYPEAKAEDLRLAECEANKEIAALRPRKRTNCECICELANEMLELDIKIDHLSTAINADPEYVDESSKDLWPVQLEAMVSYKKALQDRIKNLIDLDAEV
jgi:hypothetical protein